jgi:hypothetical protein
MPSADHRRWRIPHIPFLPDLLARFGSGSGLGGALGGAECTGYAAAPASTAPGKPSRDHRGTGSPSWLSRLTSGAFFVEDWGLREGLGVYRAQSPPASPNAPQSGRQMGGATAVGGIVASMISWRPRRTLSDLARKPGMHRIRRGARIDGDNWNGCHCLGLLGLLGLLGAGPDGLLNQRPKNCFKDVLPVGAAAMMSARASESAMTAK